MVPTGSANAYSDALTSQQGALSRRVAGELELRHKAQQPRSDPAVSSLGKGDLEVVLGQLEAGVILTGLDRKVLYANRALTDVLGLDEGELRGWTQASFVHRLAALSDDSDGLLRRLTVLPEGPILARDELVLTQPGRRVLRWTEKPVGLSYGVTQLGIFTDITSEEQLRTDSEIPIMFVDDDY